MNDHTSYFWRQRDTATYRHVCAVADRLWIAIADGSPDVAVLLYKLQLLTTKPARKPARDPPVRVD